MPHQGAAFPQQALAGDYFVLGRNQFILGAKTFIFPASANHNKDPEVIYFISKNLPSHLALPAPLSLCDP